MRIYPYDYAKSLFLRYISYKVNSLVLSRVYAPGAASPRTSLDFVDTIEKDVTGTRSGKHARDDTEVLRVHAERAQGKGR